MNKINLKFFLLFFSFFLISKHLFSAETLEDGGREKRLGIESKNIESEHVTKEKFIRDIELNNLEKINLFIRHSGKDLNFLVNGINPFAHAANINNFQLVKFFLENCDVEIDVKDKLGNTALIYAADKGNLEIIEYLINKGADVNFQNDQGLTPIMKSAEKNNFYVTKFLLEKNADISKSDYSGRTLKEIVENSRDKRILKLLN